MSNEQKQGQQLHLDRDGLLIQGLQEASTHFNLGNILSIERLRGNMNRNFSVVTHSGDQYIFKAPIKHSFEDLEAEVAYLDRLQEYHYPAAYYVRDTDGSPIFQFGNDIVMIQPKLEGEAPQFTAEVCYSVGQNIATLHQIPINDLPERDHWLKQDFLSQQIGLVQTNLPDKAQKFVDAFEEVAQLDYARLPQSIVHGDLYEDNCLYNGSSLVAILDWEEAGVAPAVLDLGTCIFNFCFEDDTFKPGLYRALIEGYQQIRPLEEAERQSLDLAVKYVALTLSAWRLVQFGINNPNPDIEKRAEIYWNLGLDDFHLPDV